MKIKPSITSEYNQDKSLGQANLENGDLDIIYLVPPKEASNLFKVGFPFFLSYVRLVWGLKILIWDGASTRISSVRAYR